MPPVRTEIWLPADEKKYFKGVIGRDWGRAGMTGALRVALLLLDEDYPIELVVEGQPSDDTLKALQEEHAAKLATARAKIKALRPQLDEIIDLLR